MTPDIDPNSNVRYKGQRHALEQTKLFADWLAGLRDTAGRARIIKRLVRLADGQFGDVKPVGGGVYELRMFFGPGYRVYFMKNGDLVILLLAGGDKNSQSRDIERAKQIARNAHDGRENKAV